MVSGRDTGAATPTTSSDRGQTGCVRNEMDLLSSTTTSAAMPSRTLNASCRCSRLEHDLRLGRLHDEPSVVVAHLRLHHDRGGADVQRACNGVDRTGAHGAEEVRLRL